MYRAVPDLERLKRFGRWKSNAFHAYLWKAHEAQKGLAEAMSAQGCQLTVGSADRGEGGGEESPRRRKGTVRDEPTGGVLGFPLGGVFFWKPRRGPPSRGGSRGPRPGAFFFTGGGHCCQGNRGPLGRGIRGPPGPLEGGPAPVGKL